MNPDELKAVIDDGVSLLINVCDTDETYWATLGTGRDVDAIEDSGYECGYRDALSAVQQLIAHDDPETLRLYFKEVAAKMDEQRSNLEAEYDGPFWWDPAKEGRSSA